MAEEIITDKTINPVFQRAINVRGWVDVRAYEIKQELAQFLACLLCPNFLDDPSYPQDVKDKAHRILSITPGFSIGNYTDTLGLRIIREDVAKYISRRDGYPADADDVIMVNGGARGIQMGMASLETSSHDGKGRAGLMIPIPTFPMYIARSIEYNLYQIPYYLDEENSWSLDISELKRALDEARPHCTPRGLVLVNPGNPTGQVLTYDNIKEIIKFCAREKLVLFADEVYQEIVFTKELPFHSCKKVLRDLGPEYNNFQLMSLQSASKGFYGE